MTRFRPVRLAAACCAVVIVGLVAFAASRLLVRVPVNSATIRRICEAQNTQGRKEVALWEHIIGLGSTPPGQEATVAAFRIYIHETFKPQRCS